MNIRILPSNLVNQIAAGEVIERPASVVKELVENSIDAGSSNIEIYLQNGGTTFISIVDNGKGMSKDDLLLATERHATSKLPDDNLFNISFLGFRGEALPSIASVARLCIISRQKNSDNAWKIEINGGSKSEPVISAGNLGTRIEVRDLFYNQPARLKFLKSPSRETAACIEILQRIALANPHISFSLYSDGKKKLFYPKVSEEAHQMQLDRLSDIIGSDFRENSVLIDAQKDNHHIYGYVSLPTYNKANSLSQYLFVNNRPLRDKILLGAIKGAYQDVLVSNRYPACAIFIDVPKPEVDVNVHPNKTEVRFFQSQLVRGLLVTAIRNALSRSSAKTSNSINLQSIMQVPQTSDFNILRENISTIRPAYNYQSKMPQSHIQAVIPQLKQEFSVKTEKIQEPENWDNVGVLGLAKAQINNTYIISQTQDSLIIVDQHAAHERIVMEKLKAGLENHKSASQILLIPEIVRLSHSEKIKLLEFAPKIAELGLVIEEFGTTEILVREIPALLKNADVVGMIKALAQQINEWEGAFDLEKKLHLACATIACHGSIRAGRSLNIEEMNQLLRDMEKTPKSGQCNHGRPTYIEMKINDISHLFERS